MPLPIKRQLFLSVLFASHSLGNHAKGAEISLPSASTKCSASLVKRSSASY